MVQQSQFFYKTKFVLLNTELQILSRSHFKIILPNYNLIYERALKSKNEFKRLQPLKQYYHLYRIIIIMQKRSKYANYLERFFENL